MPPPFPGYFFEKGAVLRLRLGNSGDSLHEWEAIRYFFRNDETIAAGFRSALALAGMANYSMFGVSRRQ